MPKSHVIGGPSYAGHVDVSAPDAVTPEWVAAPAAGPVEPAPKPVKVVEPERPTSRVRTNRKA